MGLFRSQSPEEVWGTVEVQETHGYGPGRRELVHGGVRASPEGGWKYRVTYFPRGQDGSFTTLGTSWVVVSGPVRGCLRGPTSLESYIGIPSHCRRGPSRQRSSLFIYVTVLCDVSLYRNV